MAGDGAQDIHAVLQRLADMDRRSREQESLVPATMVKEEDWQGLAFVLDGVKVISAMNEIRELLPYPEAVTRVPGTKSWMLGLANIRGELLPIVDLQQFIGGGAVVVDDHSRVLVIRNRGASTGLLVSSVLGMRHLPLSKQIADAHFDGTLGRYVYDIFGLDDGVWPVFSMAALANDKHFMTAAQQ
ncbi:chemotaxis protein CheW [Thiolapillus sp.]|uniref:chemotaxis protein CheW n=1 Tax=Thiolapillus sp. TaxID=2017437 RepID=UPI0025E556E9|nr:chemotaxis protein CheW [Thiolapillus sp.]